MALAWNNPASAMDTGLESLSADNIIINVDVTRQRVDKWGSHIWTVTYTKNKNHWPPGSGNIDELTCDTYTLTSGSTCAVTEVQSGSTGLGGTFELNFENAPDGPVYIDYDEDPLVVKDKIEALSTTSRVFVTRNEYPTSFTGGWGANAVVDATQGGYEWKVTFLRNLGAYDGTYYQGILFPPGSGAIPLLNTYDGTLTGTVKQATVVRLVKGSNATTKNFSLSYEGQTTSTMHYDASAAEVEYKLEALGNVGDVSVERNLRVDKKLNVSLTVNRGEGNVGTSKDLRGFLTPGDVVRLGDGGPNAKPGTDGDADLPDSFYVVAGSKKIFTGGNQGNVLFEGRSIRIQGKKYTIAKGSQEVKTITISATDVISAGGFKLSYTHTGREQSFRQVAFHTMQHLLKSIQPSN